MKKGLKETDLPEPWYDTKSKRATAAKKTRAASKSLSELQEVEVPLLQERNTRGRGQGKGKLKETNVVKSKHKGKSVRNGTAEVVLGKAKIKVPDPEELRRKRIEDAVYCGRVIRTVPKPAKRRSCPMTGAGDSSEENIQEELEAADLELHTETAATVEAIPLSPGLSTILCSYTVR